MDLTSPSRRVFLKGSLSTMLCASVLSACGGASETDDTPATPTLHSVENFRDMAGTGDGYPTADGRRVQRGVFYRSGALTADDADAIALSALSLRTLHDLRTASEATLTPDRVLAGVTRESQPIAPIDAAAATPADTFDASAWMIAQQRHLIGDPAARAQFGALLSRLARTAGRQVVHGSTGKDRTGWAAALILAIAQVPLDVIIQDYLLTNVVAQTQIEARITAHAQRLGVSRQTVTPLHQAQSATIEAAFDEMQKRFGTLNDYLTQGLGLGQDDIGMLRVKLAS